MVPEEKVAGVVVAPLGPTRQTRQLVAALFQNALAIHRVESVRKVQFEKNCSCDVTVAETPLFGGLERDLGTEWLSHPRLKGVEESTRRLLDRCAQAFGC